MPLEIRELVIKATVGDEENTASAAPASSGSSGQGEGSEELVKLCVEKVLEILKDEKER